MMEHLVRSAENEQAGILAGMLASTRIAPRRIRGVFSTMVLGKEDANVLGVVAAIVFAAAATSGHLLLPLGHEVAWLSLFGCSLCTFFASFKPTT